MCARSFALLQLCACMCWLTRLLWAPVCALVKPLEYGLGVVMYICDRYYVSCEVGFVSQLIVGYRLHPTLSHPSRGGQVYRGLVGHPPQDPSS